MPNGNTENPWKYMENTWKSKRLSYENIKPPTASGNCIVPKLKWIHNSRIAVKFRGRCLK